MADPRTSLPTASTGDGTPIEAVTLPGGSAVPTTGLRAFTVDGELVDLRVDDSGNLLISPESNIEVGGTVSLDASGLEVSGSVSLDAATLAALETITVANPTDVATLGKETTQQAIRDRLPSALSTGTGQERLRVSSTMADQATVLGTLTTTAGVSGVGSEVFADMPGMSAFAIRIQTTATTTATMAFEYTLAADPTTAVALDWMPLPGVRQDSSTVISSLALASTATGNVYVIEGGLPAGTTRIRVRRSAGTVATVPISIAGSAQPTKANVVATVPGTITTSPATSNAKMGQVGVSSVWYTDSVAALAASASFTGTSKDLAGAATGAATVNYTKEMRAGAISNVSGTLFLEVSTDAATWRRILAVPTSAAATGGLHVAEFNWLPWARYARLAFTNDATAQAHFTLQSMTLAA